jgi:hypothetical protein
LSDSERPIPEHVMLGCDMAGLSAHDVAQVAMGAAAWASGIPIAENGNLPTFQATVNRVLKAFTLRFDFDEFKATEDTSA